MSYFKRCTTAGCLHACGCRSFRHSSAIPFLVGSWVVRARSQLSHVDLSPSYQSSPCHHEGNGFIPARPHSMCAFNPFQSKLSIFSIFSRKMTLQCNPFHAVSKLLRLHFSSFSRLKFYLQFPFPIPSFDADFHVRCLFID